MPEIPIDNFREKESFKDLADVLTNRRNGRGASLSKSGLARCARAGRYEKKQMVNKKKRETARVESVRDPKRGPKESGKGREERAGGHGEST